MKGFKKDGTPRKERQKNYEKKIKSSNSVNDFCDGVELIEKYIPPNMMYGIIVEEEEAYFGQTEWITDKTILSKLYKLNWRKKKGQWMFNTSKIQDFMNQ